MKIKSNSVIALCALVMTSSAWAGERMVSASRESKQYVAPRTEECIRDREFQVDVFGLYAGARGNQEKLIGDHAWGGGIGLNYFFTRHLGAGIEGNLLDLRGHRDNLGSAGLNLFFRFASPSSCWAPYIYGGPDVVFNAKEVGDRKTPQRSSGDAFFAGHAGLGIEYRVTRNVGIFVDGRYTVVEKSDNNFATVRSGVRFAF